MKKLPIAKAVFRDLINENCYYVDKTEYVKIMSEEANKYQFIARPRRFGKSLYLDTLRAAYAGEKELFKGLYLENNWDWDTKYPIISISFGAGTVTTKEELNLTLESIINRNARKYDVVLNDKLAPLRFEELIIKLKEKYNKDVVILIDEYDKPINDNLFKPKVDEIRDTLAGFYSVLKDTEQYLKFVFLTGVSKFTKTSVFSKLNNLKDLTYDEKYSDLFGYTQAELENTFKDQLVDVDLKEVKLWYDGYKFLGSEMYNPYDILLFLDKKEYEFYWFETGTPTLLVNILKHNHKDIPDFKEIIIKHTDLQQFDINNIKFSILLLQTGYLTIDYKFKEGTITKYKLKIPNLEVRTALNEFLYSNLFYPDTNIENNSFSSSLYHSFADKEPARLEKIFYDFFEGIPHDWHRKNIIANYEGYYHSLFYTAFSALGFNTIAEDSTKRGDIDLTVITDDAIYVFEFKMINSPKTAMQQIKEKEYYKKYLSEGKSIFLIGVEFDNEAKNISDFEWEKLVD